jgi:hypothetical protein
MGVLITGMGVEVTGMGVVGSEIWFIAIMGESRDDSRDVQAFESNEQHTITIKLAKNERINNFLITNDRPTILLVSGLVCDERVG